jgi:hypothetical protein
VVRQFAQVPDSELGTRLRAEIVPGRTTVISRPELADHWLAAGLDVAIEPVKPGLPCTGLWAALAEQCRTRRGAGRHRIVLADHDAELGYLNICRFDTATPGEHEG